VFGLLGPNGAGKTTTLEMIEGLTPPDSGDIEVCGLRWRDEAAEIRSRIGVQLQATSLYNKITPREALDLFGSYYPRRRPTEELLELVQLQEKADAYHITLSGGQAQRLALALALVNDPEVVFLDEPTGGLDPQGRRSLWDVVRGMKAAGSTVMLTTHYMDEAQALADRVAVIASGRIIAAGTPDDLGGRRDAECVISFELPGRDPGALEAAVAGEWSRTNGRLSLRTGDPTRSLHELTGWALDNGIGLEALEVTRPSLEDVYLELTAAEEES
jgi:ABC-2 type transport system ATP-binding protein